jgi:microcystin-dependent protein
MADFNTVFENARPYDDRPNMRNRKNTRVQKQIKRKTCAQTKIKVSQKRGTEGFTIPSDDNKLIMNGKKAMMVIEKDTPKERLVIDGNGKGYPAGIILNNYAEFNYDAEFQGEEVRNKGKLLNSKGIGVGGHPSTTDLDRRSIQISTDKSYGGAYDDHTGSLIYSKMPGGWGSAQTGIRHSIEWGKFADEDSITIGHDKTIIPKDLEVGGKITGNGAVLTGSIIQWLGDTPPIGYLECDGNAISRKNYSGLYTVIGTKFGQGDGATTFNLPDYRGYVLVGKNPTDTDTNTIDDVHRGEKTHMMTINELPSHTHITQAHRHNLKIIDSGHKHTISQVNSSGNPKNWEDTANNGDMRLMWKNVRPGAWGASNPYREVDNSSTGITVSEDDATVVINNSGGDTHFNLMQPYKVIMHCIKT